MYRQGVKPLYRENPNIAKANNFIGLMVRFKVLAKMRRTPEGMIYLKWSADTETCVMKISVMMPDGWTYHFRKPASLTGWNIYINDRKICS